MTDSDLWPPLRVSALFSGRLGRDIANWAPTDIVSLIDPDLEAERRPIFPNGVRVIQRPFFDVHSPQDQSADAGIVADVIGFLNDWLPRRATSRLLVHCHMGVSRSTGFAYVALAMAGGAGRETEAFAHLLKITNKPWPNRLVIALADAALRRDGRMLAEIDAYRTRHARRLVAYGRLNRRRGLY